MQSYDLFLNGAGPLWVLYSVFEYFSFDNHVGGSLSLTDSHNYNYSNNYQHDHRTNDNNDHAHHDHDHAHNDNDNHARFVAWAPGRTERARV